MKRYPIFCLSSTLTCLSHKLKSRHGACKKQLRMRSSCIFRSTEGIPLFLGVSFSTQRAFNRVTTCAKSRLRQQDLDQQFLLLLFAQSLVRDSMHTGSSSVHLVVYLYGTDQQEARYTPLVPCSCINENGNSMNGEARQVNTAEYCMVNVGDGMYALVKPQVSHPPISLSLSL